MRNVEVRPMRDLRNKYAEVERLIEDHDPVIITKNGRGSEVLINIDDFAEVEEYLHYKYVAEKLDEAEAAAEPGVQRTDYKTVMIRLKAKYAEI
jgi:prevent-host-death family protein